MEPENVAVRTFEFSININESLDIIITRRDLLDTLQGESKNPIVDNCRRIRIKALDVLSEERNTSGSSHLESWLRFAPPGKNEINTSGDGF